MSVDPAVLLSALAAAAALAALVAVLILVPRQRALVQHLRLLAEQGVAGTRAEAETTRAALRGTGTETAERLATLRGAMDTGVEQIRTTLSREQGELRLALADGQAKTATVDRRAVRRHAHAAGSEAEGDAGRQRRRSSPTSRRR